MRSLICLLFVLFTLGSEAATRTTFFGRHVMIQVTPKDLNGAVDSDSIKLYQAMNVPIRDSFLGKGKAIVAANRILNFVCAIRSSTNYECSIIIQHSPLTVMDPLNKRAKFEAQGALADEIRLQFFLTQSEYHFKSADNVFRVEAIPGRFILEYSEQGF